MTCGGQPNGPSGRPGADRRAGHRDLTCRTADGRSGEPSPAVEEWLARLGFLRQTARRAYADAHPSRDSDAYVQTRERYGSVSPPRSVDGVLGKAVPWRDLETAAPHLARLGLERLTATGIALLGTLRPDGAPRISPVEPYVAHGQLVIGAMTASLKTSDLRCDPRYVLHSTVTGPDTGEGEFKLYGTAIEGSDALRGLVNDAWWTEWPPDKSAVFSLHVAQAAFIDWDLEQRVMIIHRWSLHGGYTTSRRAYP